MLVWIGLAIVLAFLFRHPYFVKDVQHFLGVFNVRRRLTKYQKTNFTIVDRFEEAVKEQPLKPFIRFRDETFTYRDVDELSNKAARVFLQSGLVSEGDAVALFLSNEPMYAWLWLSLGKLGCSAALLNYNIRSRSLLHCMSCSGARVLVASEGEVCKKGWSQ